MINDQWSMINDLSVVSNVKSSTKTSAISIANTTIISIAMMPVTSSAKKTIKMSVVQIQSVVQI